VANCVSDNGWVPGYGLGCGQSQVFPIDFILVAMEAGGARDDLLGKEESLYGTDFFGSFDLFVILVSEILFDCAGVHGV